MKRTLHIFGLLFISINLFAQAPQKMSYQAVIRNASNNLVTNAPVKMRITILQGSALGTAVYSELHSATTNANGLATIEIGAGTSPTGTFSSINWGNGTYFLKTETDPNNGTNYTITGTSQLLSVPYALQANNAGNGIKDISKTGDTVFLDNGKKYIIPGIKDISPSTTINNGLIAFYPFNGNANDESGNGNNGTTDGVSLTTDRYGNANKAYSFDGLNDGIQIDAILLPNTPISYSINFWCLLDNPISTASGYTIFDDCDSLQWFCKGRFISNDNFTITNKSLFEFRETPSKVFDDKLTINNWVNFTCVLDLEKSKIFLYRDGKLINQSNYVINSYVAGNRRMQIGRCQSPISYNGINYFTSFWDGKIDDLRFYNRVLTQEEITWLANN